MADETETPIERRREDFARFVTVLTGEMGVSVGFGGEPGARGSRIILPDLGSLDAKRLDFLYALCLREVGFIAKSRRRPSTIALLRTQEELAMAFSVESARTERLLKRAFGGGREILDRHWIVEAADRELSAAAFGYDPADATPFQAFAAQAKLHLLGGMDYGWDRLFGKEAWAEAAAVAAAPGVRGLLNAAKPRCFENSVELGKNLVLAWHTVRGDEDASAPLRTGPKAEAWEKARKALTEEIPGSIREETEKQQASKARAKEIEAEIKASLGASAKELKELNKKIAKLSKSLSPLRPISLAMEAAKRWEEAAEASRLQAAAAAAKEAELRAAADERGGKLEEKAGAVEAKAAEAAAKLRERMDDALEAARKRLESLEARARKAESSAEAAASAGKDERRAALEEKVRELMERLAEESAKAAAKAAELRSKAEEIEAKAEARAEDLRARAAPTERAAAAMGKAKAAEEQSKAAAGMQEEEAERRREEAEAQARLVSKGRSKSLSSMTEEELLSKAEELSRALEEARGEKGAIEEPIRERRKELSKERAVGREAGKAARKKAAFRLQEIQAELDEAGIEADLFPKRHDIEGWNVANDVQKEFDDAASEALGEPVVNGSGGGKGNRDVLAEIALKADGIEDIDPNEIFADVARLSPLSGLSQTGARDGGEGVRAHESGDPAPLESARTHTVWRRDLDKILPARIKDAALIRRLRSEHADTLARLKALFRAKMKPSSKPRFIGGREEGDLDPRAMWKLAANTGEDFYEIQRRRPHNKIAASLLIDLSGSCASWGADASEKIQALAFLLSEALTECSVEHEILGHRAPWDSDLADQKIPDGFNRKACRLETIVAKGFGERDLSGLASLEVSQADNSDGESLRVAMNRLRKRSARKRVVFLIGDGKPFMQDSDAGILDEDLRRALVEAANDKIAVVSLGFGTAEHAVLGPEHIRLAAPSDLPKAIEPRL